MRTIRIVASVVVAAAGLLVPTSAKATVPCIAFVHGHWYDNSGSADADIGDSSDYGYGYTRTRDVYWKKSGGYQSGTNMYTGWGATTSGGYDNVVENAIRSNNVGTVYWRTQDNGDSQGNFVYYATNGYAVDFAAINYNSHEYYWTVGGEVANDLLKVCTDNSWVVTHSMGGRVMAWIMGNSVSGDPYYNYAGVQYSAVRAKYNTWFSVHGALGGADTARLTCNMGGNGPSHCCYGVQSLQPGWSPQYENGTRITTYLIGGFDTLTLSSLATMFSDSLNGEDDGVLNHAEAYFCNDQPNDSNSVGYDHFCSGLEDVDTGLFDGCGDHPSNKCQGSGGSTAYNKRRTGYRNYDTGDENHDEVRNGSDHGHHRRAVSDGYWGGSPGDDYGWTGSAADEIGFLAQ